MQSNERVTLPLTEYTVPQIKDMTLEELEASALITSEDDLRKVFKQVTGKNLPNKTIRRLFT